MAPIIEFSKSDKTIGLVVKPARIGPEIRLSNLFLEKMTAQLAKRKTNFAIFNEPQLETGFPDIVVVSFSPGTFKKWKNERMNLSVMDIKLLHHLYFVGGDRSDNIETMLGLDSKSLIRSLERLLSADLVNWKRKIWKPLDFRSVFGLTNITAIETKIKNWSEAFRQAEMNWWFASESYVLSPITRPQKQILDRANCLDVGLYSMTREGSIARLRQSKRESLPLSYASWLFNEWVGRRLHS